MRTRHATVRSVDIFAVPVRQAADADDTPVHGGEIDTSLLLYIDAELVRLDLARDYEAPRRVVRRYHRGSPGAIPKDSPGSIGRPSLASPAKGELLYRQIYDRVASRVFRGPVAPGVRP